MKERTQPEKLEKKNRRVLYFGTQVSNGDGDLFGQMFLAFHIREGLKIDLWTWQRGDYL